MKLYTVADQKRHFIAAEYKGTLVDLATAHQAFLASGKTDETVLKDFPKTMLGLARWGKSGLHTVERLLQFISRRPVLPLGVQLFYPPEEVKILPPLPRPGKIILCDQMEPEAESWSFRSKFPSTVAAINDPVVLPQLENKCASGGLFQGLVIGEVPENSDQQGRGELLRPNLLGYTVLLDFICAKEEFAITLLPNNFPGSCVMGPSIMRGPDWSEIRGARISVLMEGKIKRQSKGIFQGDKIVAVLDYLSARINLEPGDVIGLPLDNEIVKGGPFGCYFRIDRGDEIAIEIDGVPPWKTPIH